MVKKSDHREFEGGAEPVRQHREEVPKTGRTVGQTLIIALVVLVALAAFLWLVVPIGGS